MGHAATSQTEEYVRLFAEVDYRKEVAMAVGLGFDLLPAKPIVRTVRRNVAQLNEEKAA